MTNELAPVTPQNPMALLMGADLSTIDPDKLEKLLALQERWEDRQAEKALAAALSDFQAECPTIKKERKNTHLNTAYAKIDDIMAAIQPVLSRHGLSVSFDTPSNKESLTAICYVMHSAGAKFSRQVTVPVDTGMRGANITQQLGSASSYAQRYALIAALNLNVTDRQDDDGGVSGAASLSDEESNQIHAMLEECPQGTVGNFLRFFESETVEEIPARDFNKAVTMLKAKIKKGKE